MFSVVLQSWPLILLSCSKLCSKNVEHKIKFDGLIWLFHSNSFIIRIASQILTDFSEDHKKIRGRLLKQKKYPLFKIFLVCLHLIAPTIKNLLSIILYCMVLSFFCSFINIYFYFPLYPWFPINKSLRICFYQMSNVKLI